MADDPIVTDLSENSNFYNADEQMKLTPAEKNLYKHHLGNLHMGGVKNRDGSTSTILTVWDNKIVPDDQAVANARRVGIEHFPAYDSQEQATSRYMQMHSYMDGDIR